MPIDLSKFDLAAAERCGHGLADATRDAPTLEAAARAGCTYLREELRDADGQPTCALVRCYKTHTYGGLPTDVQRAAKRAYGAMAFSPPEPELRCLILMATVGDEPAWNDRRTSRNHQAIPLPSREIVESAPMIAQLIRELGLDVAELVQPTKGVVRELAGKSYGVFHVAEALGSPYIPAQDFVRRYAIRSVVGFGGGAARRRARRNDCLHTGRHSDRRRRPVSDGRVRSQRSARTIRSREHVRCVRGVNARSARARQSDAGCGATFALPLVPARGHRNEYRRRR